MPSHPLCLTNILLDRDGTLIKECHYLCDPDKVELIPGIITPMRRLHEEGARFFLVTNQSGIGRGYFSMNDYEAVQQQLTRMLAEEGIVLTGGACCPHAPDEECTCRKPNIGMWRKLAAKYGLVPGQTVMIGDKRADITFGRNASLYTILVLTGHGAQEARALGIPHLEQNILEFTHPDQGQPHVVAKNLGVALEWIAQKSERIDAAGHSNIL